MGEGSLDIGYFEGAAELQEMENPIGQRLGWLAGEKSGMGKSNCVKLILDRGGNLRVAMAEAGNRRPAGTIVIAFPGCIAHVTPLTAHDDRRC